VKYQTSPNRWSCLLTSFANVLDCEVKQLVEEIGHDGSAILYQGLADPIRRRAFHIQEFFPCCHSRGFVPLNIDAQPVLAVPYSHYSLTLDGTDLLRKFMTVYKGVLIGETRGQSHAWSWDTIDLFDPSIGRMFDIRNVAIRSFISLITIQS